MKDTLYAGQSIFVGFENSSLKNGIVFDVIKYVRK